MAKVDFESAWLDLAKLVEAREGWGSKHLLAEMQKLAVKHEISESFLERALRMYGGQITLVAAGHMGVAGPLPIAGDPSSGPSGTPPVGAASAPAHSKTQEVANGSIRAGHEG